MRASMRVVKIAAHRGTITDRIRRAAGGEHAGGQRLGQPAGAERQHRPAPAARQGAEAGSAGAGAAHHQQSSIASSCISRAPCRPRRRRTSRRSGSRACICARIPPLLPGGRSDRPCARLHQRSTMQGQEGLELALDQLADRRGWRQARHPGHARAHRVEDVESIRAAAAGARLWSPASICASSTSPTASSRRRCRTIARAPAP